mmetsp:Transcript_33588/g.87331  ORF Transcript_33588/g.87331 Transcript_33588/m.87331 type:complete len:224 (-) Transcript_33588:706-1377(-)
MVSCIRLQTRNSIPMSECTPETSSFIADICPSTVSTRESRSVRCVSTILICFKQFMMSLDFASPFILRKPWANSSTVRDPSPSSKMFQSSSNSFKSNSSTCNFRRILGCWVAASNSSLVNSPLPSSSRSKNNSVSSFISFSFCRSLWRACSSSSSRLMENAFSTITAVMRFISTKTATEMKNTKKAATPGCFLMIGRATAVHESKVMIWKSVNMDSSTSPNCS